MKSIDEYYKILGVDSSVTAEELKKVYRELVKEWHPDRLLHNPSLHKTAQQKLQEINEAYDQLLAHLANPEPRSSAPKNEPRRATAAAPRKATTATAKRPVAPMTQWINRYVAFWLKASCVGPARGLRHREGSVDHRGFHFHAVVGDRGRLVLATQLTLWNRKLDEGSNRSLVTSHKSLLKPLPYARIEPEVLPTIKSAHSFVSVPHTIVIYASDFFHRASIRRGDKVLEGTRAG